MLTTQRQVRHAFWLAHRGLPNITPRRIPEICGERTMTPLLKPVARTPAYVILDGQRWHVDQPIQDCVALDGDPGYELSRRAWSDAKHAFVRQEVTARVSDCEPWQRDPLKPAKRRIRDEDHILETDGRVMTIRRKASSKRYPVSLAGIYCYAVRAEVARIRFERARAKKARKK